MTVRYPCPCGDYYCADNIPLNTIDRSDCCQYCGFFSCDVCGWFALLPAGGDQQ
ncbi:hypothetical protein ACLQ24_10025 [Micromonospora sp. DT4]|uniref:hypothetical protein n=1 Tax=Micromonospora sp. DT4 TaxID=3393438 RepID=UPI003CE89236